MQFYRIFRILPISFLIGCSSLFWRDAELTEESYTTNGWRVSYIVSYQEKNSWNPLMGTTDKKNYKTQVYLTNPKGEKKSVGVLPSWVLSGHLLYNPNRDRLFWILGVDENGYGTYQRKVGFAESIQNYGFNQTQYSPSVANYLCISPSPDGEKVGLVYEKEGATPEYRIVIIDTNRIQNQSLESSYPLPFWDETNCNDLKSPYRLVWNSSAQLSIVLKDKRLSWESGKGFLTQK